MTKPIELLLSVDRLDGYKGKSRNELEIKLHRYNFNIELSKTFYPLLHLLEVSLRNTLHQAFSDYLKDSAWLFNHTQHALLKTREREKIQDALVELKKKNRTLTEGRIIAELNFSFWVNLYDRPYLEVHKQTIKDQFPNATNPQRDIFKIKEKLNDIRLLRNRIFHYEPVWHWTNLKSDFEEAKDFIYWMNKDLFLQILKQSEKEFNELIIRQEAMLK
jgi:hypothetical protein